MERDAIYQQHGGTTTSFEYLVGCQEEICTILLCKKYIQMLLFVRFRSLLSMSFPCMQKSCKVSRPKLVHVAVLVSHDVFSPSRLRSYLQLHIILKSHRNK